ncbi:MAG: PHB depolymerase family esterase [Burkholderiaceae bacterium]|nr:PHB depolymerase family esterase [Burkholderiaceae bacterium]
MNAYEPIRFSPPSRSSSGRTTEGRFGNAPRRKYVLYLPLAPKYARSPLLVLLHGCQQTAETFAAGTRMNQAAEDAGVAVLYPQQSLSANALRCWNWFSRPELDPRGDAAEIAALTRQVIQENSIDATRVYVAGMSAGGAMAVALARTYPDLYAAMGVHSGVPAGLAHDVASAMRLMSSGPVRKKKAAASCGDEPSAVVASIVFHGDEDEVVHPSNGEAIHASATGTSISRPERRSRTATTRPSAGQRGFTRSVDFGLGGKTRRELWIVHGGGHAWAGGNEQQQHTDASGPDASREMLRFFLQHRLLTTSC